MKEKIDFSLAIGTWNAEKTKEQIAIKAYDTGVTNLPMAEVYRVLDDEGKEVDNQIIASTHDPYIMGNVMTIYPFGLMILGQNRILLFHKETGEERTYKRSI
jgi:hypothetical protein